MSGSCVGGLAGESRGKSVGGASPRPRAWVDGAGRRAALPSHYECLAIGDAGQRSGLGGLARGQHGRAGARAAGWGVWTPPVALL